MAGLKQYSYKPSKGWKNNHAEIKRKNSGRITSGGNNEKTANVNQIITIKRMSHVTNHNEDYSK
ncbi:hypothetical protein SEN2437_42390 [Salmonella enterica subsp. enterica serovar Virchow]|uniref:Uncharacterized protein n=3 Tax=Enterobacteriaceae TaxID=543 RepID=W8CU28_RAOPL|nr:hypothetical protein [Leclercia adecarboxylata]AGO89226.1 hypothetical protein pKpNDM1_00468 [Raoultella planticola]AKJ19185.1 hypothetical protein [Enterobacter cloacae]QZX58723.1 hypothetical protein [Klebsiella michiganensis]WGO47918.1 hypothetical protein [Enterobacter hormaechei]CAH2873888.1 hypothetical protein SEN2437_42390 [Salmonella enterica subsp. enterica serovar Virchow]BCL45394.1 hypothetical protein OIPHN260_48970 [Enterobacter roggenkampii]